jgi:hypothetical protein
MADARRHDRSLGRARWQAPPTLRSTAHICRRWCAARWRLLAWPMTMCTRRTRCGGPVPCWPLGARSRCCCCRVLATRPMGVSVTEGLLLYQLSFLRWHLGTDRRRGRPVDAVEGSVAAPRFGSFSARSAGAATTRAAPPASAGWSTAQSASMRLHQFRLLRRMGQQQTLAAVEPQRDRMYVPARQGRRRRSSGRTSSRSCLALSLDVPRPAGPVMVHPGVTRSSRRVARAQDSLDPGRDRRGGPGAVGSGRKCRCEYHR